MIITINQETAENALMRVIRDEIGAEIPITMAGSMDSGNLLINIDMEPLTPSQTQKIENGIEKILRMRGIKTLVDIS